MDWKLSDAEIAYLTGYGGVLPVERKVADAAASKALKAVGEWLETWNESGGWIQMDAAIEALKQGRMPE